MTGAATVADRLAIVRERIARAAAGGGRDPAEIRLVVVTKDVDAGRVREAIAAGASDLGENRAQELVRKRDALADVSPAPRWHFMGTLQRNKVPAVAGAVELVHSVDSVMLGRALAARATAAGTTQAALLEVNVSGEASKHGFRPADVAGALDALRDEPGLGVRGLMTIAPEGDPAAARHAFRGLRVLRDRLRTEGGLPLDELSMGMTGDFELAIEEGATLVRIGTAIFGARR